MNNAITLPRPSVKGIRARDYILPAAIAVACAGAAYAGADTTFDPALQKFTDFLEGHGHDHHLPRSIHCALQPMGRAYR